MRHAKGGSGCWPIPSPPIGLSSHGSHVIFCGNLLARSSPTNTVPAAAPCKPRWRQQCWPDLVLQGRSKMQGMFSKMSALLLLSVSHIDFGGCSLARVAAVKLAHVGLPGRQQDSGHYPSDFRTPRRSLSPKLIFGGSSLAKMTAVKLAYGAFSWPKQDAGPYLSVFCSCRRSLSPKFIFGRSSLAKMVAVKLACGTFPGRQQDAGTSPSGFCTPCYSLTPTMVFAATHWPGGNSDAGLLWFVRPRRVSCSWCDCIYTPAPRRGLRHSSPCWLGSPEQPAACS